jgi:hypothetical protein
MYNVFFCFIKNPSLIELPTSLGKYMRFKICFRLSLCLQLLTKLRQPEMYIPTVIEIILTIAYGGLMHMTLHDNALLYGARYWAPPTATPLGRCRLLKLFCSRIFIFGPRLSKVLYCIYIYIRQYRYCT